MKRRRKMREYRKKGGRKKKYNSFTGNQLNVRVVSLLGGELQRNLRSRNRKKRFDPRSRKWAAVRDRGKEGSLMKAKGLIESGGDLFQLPVIGPPIISK